MELSEMIALAEEWLYEFANEPTIYYVQQISDPECMAYEISYEETDQKADDFIHRDSLIVFSDGVIITKGEELRKENDKWITI